MIIGARVLGFMLSLLAKARADQNYFGFADKSDGGPINGSMCRSYGGQPLLNQHQSVVMNMGRRDPERPNVIYHGGYQYVAFSIETLSFWGKKETAIALCHFAGSTRILWWGVFCPGTLFPRIRIFLYLSRITRPVQAIPFDRAFPFDRKVH